MPISTFAERLNTALEMRHISASELSRRSGASEGLISGYRKGTYKAKQDRVDCFAQILDVSIPWLMGRDVPMGAYDGYLSSAPSTLPGNIIPLPGTYKVPIVGTIACGKPILAEENVEDYVEVPEMVQADFALYCRGDSMINARIFDGDVVYVRRQSSVENGEIAAVRIGDEATLKRVYRNGGRLILRAANPLFPDMEYEGETLTEVEILGKAVAFTSIIQ